MDLLVNGDIEIRAVTNRDNLSGIDLSMGHVVVALDVIHVYGFFDYRHKVSKYCVFKETFQTYHQAFDKCGEPISKCWDNCVQCCQYCT